MGLRVFFSISTLLLLALRYAEGKWSYPNQRIAEGDLYDKIEIVTIHSEDATTATYDIAGDFGDKFEIDHVTGEIWQVKSVDRETKDSYVITATSADASGNPTEDPVQFTIFVTDINDNEPVFELSSLTGSVEELHDRGPTSQPFMQVKATDNDLGFFAQIRYSIEADSDSPASGSGNRFIIDPVAGWVRVNGDDLNYETNPVVRFNVVAVDNNGGTGSNKVTKEVVVTVMDSNDHAPEFGPLADKSLSEISELGTPLYNMYASDIDEGVNKKVYFEILDGNTGGAFTIVSKPSDTSDSLGELQLVKRLDYESGITSYDLKIKAYNKDASNAADEAYTTVSNLKITVIDANEPPIFRNTPYNYRVTESATAPAEPVPIIQVYAEDIDFNRNQTVTYSLEDPEGWFAIVSTTGQITQVGAVDREATEDGVYHLKVIATDNYDHGNPASGSEEVAITIGDINDNPPVPDWGQDGASAYVCEKPRNTTVRLIKAADPDSAVNGPAFTFRFDDSVDESMWSFETVNDESVNLIAEFADYGLSSGSATVSLIFTVTDSGTVSQTGTATLTATICKCGDDGEFTCKDATAAAFPYAIVIAVIAVILLIAILVFAVVTYKRRQAAMILKEPFFDDEDDIRETVQVYQEEGGEEDQDTYDLSALRGPLLEDPNQPIRKEQMPLMQQAQRPRRANPPDDISNIIGEAKDVADNDPSAPPFDSLLVFDYEGAGSDAGSLSSINTATTDGSVDYDYLNDWGPRFNRLADMYNDGSESD